MTLHLSAQAVVDTCLQIEAGETVPASVQHHLSPVSYTHLTLPTKA